MGPHSASMTTRTPLFERLTPWIFVALWSTGFVVARYSTNNAGPLSFLTVRMLIAAVLLYLIAKVVKAPKLSRGSWSTSAIVGTCMHAIYLGGVFIAIKQGLPSGLSALIAGLHPVVTSVAGRIILKEKLRLSQWVGVLLGISGVLVVVVDKVRDGLGDVTRPALIAMVISVIGMSTGTLVQRARGKEMPLVTGTAAQYVSAGAVLLVASSLFEEWEFNINTELVLALLWSVFVLSIAAVMLMMLLISRHSAARVSSLFFLTPALSAIESAILFGERLSPLALVALVVALTGVWLTMRNPVVAPSPESLLVD
jgi:drug/metabolite transporter (DMT)-like permease